MSLQPLNDKYIYLSLSIYALLSPQYCMMLHHDSFRLLNLLSLIILGLTKMVQNCRKMRTQQNCLKVLDFFFLIFCTKLEATLLSSGQDAMWSPKSLTSDQLISKKVPKVNKIDWAYFFLLKMQQFVIYFSGLSEF